MIHNESTLQYLLWKHHHYKPLFCNVNLSTNEFDAIHITDAKYAIGYEIKCSKADFKADFKKQRHSFLNRGNYLNKTLGIYIRNFYFVIGNFDLTLDEVPAYAGLMVAAHHCLTIVKPAPRLWKEKVCDATLSTLYKKLALRHVYHTMENCKSQYNKRSTPPPRIKSLTESIEAVEDIQDPNLLF